MIGPKIPNTKITDPIPAVLVTIINNNSNVLTMFARLRYKLVLTNFLAANKIFWRKFCHMRKSTEKAVSANSHQGAPVLKKTLSRKGNEINRKAITINENSD